MKNEFIDAVKTLVPQRHARGKRFLFTDEEWDAIIEANDRGVTTSQLFPLVQKRGFKTIGSFRNVLALAKKFRKNNST